MERNAATAVLAASESEVERREMAKLKVTQVRSAIGIKPKQRGTLRALGLRRIGRTVEHEDSPEIRGMLARVPHLVRVEETEGRAS